MGVDLSLIWAIIILFGVMMYVVMDGFDLGIGVLFPLLPGKSDRDVMMNTVAPVWDGNETWLVLGGAGLLAAFPRAYAVVLGALYLPLVFMLLGLVFRGVAFEFRFKADEHHRPFWDRAFIGGSVAAAFFQGATLGAYLQGIELVDGAYQGGPWGWVTPFSLFCGAGLVVAYALLGCTWLIMKTEGALQQRMIVAARPLTGALLAVIAVISVWTPLIEPAIARRWFSLPNFYAFAPVPVLVLAAAWGLLRALRGQPDMAPFLLTLALAKVRGHLTAEAEADHLKARRHLPVALQAVLALEPQVIAWAEDFASKENALFLGRGLHYPIALEGALKLKEISYIHAEAYPAGEPKHGPLALVTSAMPVVTVAPNDALLEKLKSNIQEVKARGGQLYVFADADTRIESDAGVHVIRMPEHYGALSPILHVVPLQLLAYHTACARGTDVDKPRNLAKSVTVE